MEGDQAAETLLSAHEMHARREDTVLHHTTSRLEEYINIGRSTLADLRTQKHAMKSTHRRLLDATASLGISQSVMRLIGRRSNQERLIFYCGIVLTIFIIYALWTHF